MISPGSAIYDRNTKADTYAALGVRELWLVDEVAQSLEVRLLEGERYSPGTIFERDNRVVSVVLSGFSFEVRKIFGD